jgi:hypothetical protein
VIEPSDHSITAAFEELARGQLPSGSETTYADETLVAGDGHSLVDPSSVTVKVLPEAMRKFVTDVDTELSAGARKALSLFRWRHDAEVSNQSFDAAEIEWSLDGITWRVIWLSESRVRIRSRLRLVNLVPLAARAGEEVERLAAAGMSEPLAHQLLREAREIYFDFDQPRAALVIGMAALEVGIKACISVLVPDAKWLVEHVPSPPVDELLTKYLPELPVQASFAGASVAQPKQTIAVIRMGIEQRNNVVHRTDQREPDASFIRRLLDAVEDVVWLLDYYSGHEWALTHLSAECAVALGLRDSS